MALAALELSNSVYAKPSCGTIMLYRNMQHFLFMTKTDRYNSYFMDVALRTA